jgi:Zn-dependent peptidase ImmA (M78 family)
VNRAATSAVRAAAKLRAQHGIGVTDSLCPFDLAERMGIVVRFVRLASLEGIYTPDPVPTILISADRPAGRRRFTCSHEIGHHVFRHGTRLDELREGGETRSTEEESIADRFAVGILLPKLAVENACARRGFPLQAPSPEQTFILAQDFGVGYTTLIGYLQFTLQAVSASHAEALRKIRPATLRRTIGGAAADLDVLIADNAWGARPIDLAIGDVALTPTLSQMEGRCVEFCDTPSPRIRASAAGTESIVLAPERAPTLVRVSRRGFVGLARYRYLEEVADE